MSTVNNFKSELYEAAEKKSALIDSTTMPKMLENYRSIHSSLKGLINLFETKKLILPDPYKQETRLADITIPTEEDFTDSEGPTVFGIRISEYELSLDFLCNYGIFTLEALTPDRIKKLFTFNSFIDWNSLTHFNTQPNTRYLKISIDSIKNSTDSMAIGLINTMITTITKNFTEINNDLKNLSNIQKEFYKVEVRQNIIDSENINSKYLENNGQNAIEIIKKVFPVHMKNKKFYPALIEEILLEDFAENKQDLQQSLLEKLHTENKKKEKVEEKVDTKEMILNVVKIMHNFTPALDSIQKKIQENHELLQSEKKSVMDKFITALRTAFGLKPKPIEYKIKTVDMLSNLEKTETINYYNFIESLGKIIRTYAALGSKNSQILAKLEESDEEDILTFVQKRLSSFNAFYGILVGLDSFFKSEVHQANRAKVKGLKMDLDVLKNSVLKANRNKAEYVSTITFEKQMSKLGVTNE